MANKIGVVLASEGLLTDVDSAARQPVLTRCSDEAGNEYIYLLGVASTAVGSWVSFDEAGVTTLLQANSLGRVGIAMAATVAAKYGWYCIYGTVPGLCLASYADNAKVWATSTLGSVDDADVAVDLVDGAIGRSARNTTTGLATFELSYPVCMNEVKN